MSEIPVRDVDVPWSDEPEPWRAMTEAEERERGDLRAANTSERLRARAVAVTSEANGTPS